MSAPETVEAYIAQFPDEVRARLESMRATVRKAAPEAEERIAYGMPAYWLNGPLVYFGAAKAHIGFYGTPSGHDAFAAELSGYKGGRGSVQFPFSQDLPLNLVARIVAFRVKENLAKPGKAKTKAKKTPKA